MFNPLALTHNQLRITTNTITIKALPKSLEGFKLVQVSDLHFYEHTCKKYYQQVTEQVVALAPDVILMTGDAVHLGARYVPQATAFLSALPARYGRFAILGNHDYDDGHYGRAVKAGLIEAGFTVLVNEAVSISVPLSSDSLSSVHAFDEFEMQEMPFESVDGCLTIAGLDDLWYGKPDIEKTLEQIPAHATVIMMSHNPLLFDPVALGFPGRVDLLVSGHTHAGHVYIPFLGPIYRRIFRMKYRYGLYEKNGSQLYVTSGLGSAAFGIKKKQIGFPRFRWNTIPEIAVLTLKQL